MRQVWLVCCILLSASICGNALSSSSGTPDSALPQADAAKESQEGAAAGEDEIDSATLFGKSKDPMQDLLHWAVQHSDPEKLAEIMQKYKDSNLTLKDVYGEDMVDALFVNEADVMQDSIRQIADFRNPNITDGELEDSLGQLRDLVEQVDNAANLHVLGGLAPLLDLCTAADARPSQVRSSALWTLGVAVQNNAPVQLDLHGLGAAEQLVGSLPRCGMPGVDSKIASEGDQFCGKLMFTLSALTRNNGLMQSLADSLGLFDWLIDVGLEHTSASVAKKAMALLDTVIAQSPGLPFLLRLEERAELVQLALLARLRGNDKTNFDIDAAEKAVQLARQLLAAVPSSFTVEFQARLHAAMHDAVGRCVKDLGVEACESLAAESSSVETASTEQWEKEEAEL